MNYDIILGLNFLNESQAVIDVSKNSLVLYRGLLVVPSMTPTGVAPLVKTVASVIVPPLSEAVFPVKTDRRRTAAAKSRLDDCPDVGRSDERRRGMPCYEHHRETD